MRKLYRFQLKPVTFFISNLKNFLQNEHTFCNYGIHKYVIKKL